MSCYCTGRCHVPPYTCDGLREPAPDLTAAKTAYELLPESIKLTLSFVQYLWLSDAEKASLEQRETEPEQYHE